MSAELGIEHEAEEFRWLHWDKYWTEDDRIYTDVMPFFWPVRKGGPALTDS